MRVDCKALNDNEALAKDSPVVGGGTVYFIKAYSSDHSIVNPLDPNEFNMKSRTVPGQEIYEWRRVPKDIFDSYLKFLQTEHMGHFLYANKEMINA